MSNAHNKKAKIKSFSIGDLVLRLILPIGRNDWEYEKWPPNWEGSFQIYEVARDNTYFLKTLSGSEKDKLINEKYLRKYYPSVGEKKMKS